MFCISFIDKHIFSLSPNISWCRRVIQTRWNVHLTHNLTAIYTRSCLIFLWIESTTAVFSQYAFYPPVKSSYIISPIITKPLLSTFIHALTHTTISRHSYAALLSVSRRSSKLSKRHAHFLFFSLTYTQFTMICVFPSVCGSTARLSVVFEYLVTLPS